MCNVTSEHVIETRSTVKIVYDSLSFHMIKRQIAIEYNNIFSIGIQLLQMIYDTSQ
jgi:hypothetical protein